ncbi:MAG: OmpA family protein, partial [Gammaproteobacteria bacterium]
RDKPLFLNRTFFNRARNRRTEAEVRFHVLEGAPVPVGAVEASPAATSESAAEGGADTGTTAPKIVTGIAHRIDVDGSAPVQNLRVMAMLPEGYLVEPGTTRIDDKSAADPEQDGTLVTFAAGDVDIDARSGRWQRAITFRVRLAPGAPAASATAAVPVTPVGEVEKYTLNAEFDSCRTELKPEAEAVVNDLIAQLKGADIARIELTGNTDDQQLSANCRKRFADNDDLSRARARVIGERLATALQLQPSQIVSRGEGSRRPLLSNLTLLGKARNRRTEVRVFLRAGDATAVPVAGNAAAATSAAAACNTVYEVKALAAFAAGSKPVTRTPAASSAVQCPAAAAPVAGSDAAAPAAVATDDKAAGENAAEEHPIEEHTGERQSIVIEGASVKAPDADLLARRKARDSIVDDVAASRAGFNWLAGQQPGVAWLFPTADYNPRSPSTRIIIKHAPGQDVVLQRADGSAVSGLAFDGTQVSADKTVAVSAWRAVSLHEGRNEFRAIVKNADGTVAGTVEGAVAYANTPARAELVPEQSILRADGMTRPVIAVRIRDRDGTPVRHGVGGSLRINKPYTAWEEVERQQNRALAGLDRFEARYLVEGDDGIAYIELAPTTETGNVELTLGVDSGSAVAGSEVIRAWIEPTPRDWVVVGFAEGTVGYQTLHDNIQPLLAQGEEEGSWTDGQVSLYAKGRVLGSWLLTMAYDSDRTDERGRQKALLSQIDPDEYYTLYGDGTEQRDDAPSQDNLYLKLERRQFYALFGDYDTGLNQTKLSRYNRTLNGVKAENGGGPVTFIVFAAETAQNTARDEIQGNGTSGLYRLSQGNIMLNGERIAIEVRDRLHGDRVLETRLLSRHLDYEIDYAAGTLYFKQPVNSRDGSFNPVFIVAEYETFGVADRTLNAGGRIAVAVGDNERIKVGVSAIRDEDTNGATGLIGTDVEVKLGENTEVRLEAATTDGNQAIAPRDGDAFLVEVEHHAGRVDALAYVRRQGVEFGVDQQNASDSGQQTAGVEGRVKLDENWSVRGDISQRENLATTATRDALAGTLRYDTKRGGVGVGARVVEDEMASGALAGQPVRSEQMTLEANRFYFDRKLELLTQAESSLGTSNASIDYPDRVMVGANYQLAEHARLLAGQEFAESDFLRTSTTRVGVQVLPWKGARLESTLNQSYISEYGPRTFGQYGLTQAVMLGDRWGLDFSADASQTLNESARPAIDVDPAHPVSAGGMIGSAGLTEDFWALSAGATWRAPVWSWNGRMETRDGETTDKDGLTSRFLRQATAGIAFATSAKVFRAEQESGTEGWLASVDLSWAWRPLGVHWSILDRLEFRYEDIDGGTGIAGNGLFGNTSLVAGDATTRRIINNFALNRVSKEWTGRDRKGDLFNRYERNQFSLYYGAKYALDTFDGTGYSGYTDIIGVEVRHDITKYVDIGVQASSLNSWSAGTHEYSVGPMIGFSPVENGWITLGYNHRGFYDSDFDAARYTMQGFYLQLRLKFDQNTKLRWKTSSREEGSHAGR